MAVAVNSHRKMKMEGGLAGGRGKGTYIYLSVCKTVALIFSNTKTKQRIYFLGLVSIPAALMDIVKSIS